MVFMYKLVSPQSLMAKRAIPEHRRMTSLPLLAASEKPTQVNQLQMTTTTSVRGIMASDLAQRYSWGQFSLYPCSTEVSN